MKPRYCRELKKFRLRHARKPLVHAYVAGVVHVYDKGRRLAYIKFDESLVEAIGQAMPAGVSPDCPCYLKVVKLVTGRWRVLACYVGEKVCRVLWEADSLPWVKTVHQGE